MAGRLDGKVAIVTGAGGGIGREHAPAVRGRGRGGPRERHRPSHRCGRRRGRRRDQAAGGTAVADTSSATWDGAGAIVQHALDAFGRLDIVVNNATAARNADLWRVTEQDWDLAIGVNLKGYFAMIREAAPHLCGKAPVRS